MLVGIAIAGMLATGCGPGTATGAGPRYAANPRLHGTGPRQPASGSAASVARQIAVRWAAAGASARSRTMPIEYRTSDYTATVFSPGTPSGFDRVHNHPANDPGHPSIRCRDLGQ
jgi:hypothetical protein